MGSTAGDVRRSYSFTISEAEGAHAAVVDVLRMSFLAHARRAGRPTTCDLRVDLAGSRGSWQEEMSRTRIDTIFIVSSDGAA